jgi:hypothetical protein
MRDEESYAVDGKEVIDGPYEKDMEKPLDASKLEPFGNEETAEVKYRTMKWWYVFNFSMDILVNADVSMANIQQLGTVECVSIQFYISRA